MVKKILAWVILAVLVAYVISAAIWARGEARKNTCSGISVEISRSHTADSVTKKGVLAEITRYPQKITGQPIAAIDTKKIENYLKSNAQFEDVSCNFTTDGKLQVRVIPMVPELRVFDDSLSYYINKDGKKMKSKASFFVDVPVVSGKFSSKFPAKDLLSVTRFISGDPILSKLISMVYATGPDNIILVPRIHGHVINFGDTSRLAEKRNALIAMYRKVLPYKGWEEYDTISVKFKGQVVATRRNKGSLYKKYDVEEDVDLEESTLPAIEQTEILN